MQECEFNLYPDISSELMKKQFEQDNFLIEYSKKKSNLAVIYFSSNGIYNPNDEETFKNEIMSKNKFEYYKTRIRRASKHIFIRDVLKQFYAKGINKNIDSIDKVVDFLKTETEGMEVITIGSSSGGYSALIAGILLNAKAVFAFSPIISIYEDLNTEEILKSFKFVYEGRNYSNCSKYYNISKLVDESKVPIMYFYPQDSEFDVRQFSCLSKNNANICLFRYSSDMHGSTLERKSLQSYLNSSTNTLKFINKFLLREKKSKKTLKRIFKIKYFLDKLTF